TAGPFVPRATQAVMNPESSPMMFRLVAIATLLLTLRISPAAAQEDSPAQDWAGEHVGTVAELYRELHQAPELSFEEEKTAARMAQELRALGADVQTGIGGHGLVGVLANGDGPTLLLRADMDA